MRLVAVVVAGLLGAGCHMRGAVRTTLPALVDEGEVHVYLERFPRDAERLGLVVAEAALLRPDGSGVPLRLILAQVDGRSARDQRLLAWGRVAPGQYTGLSVKLARATLGLDEPRSDLVVPAEPIRVEAPFDLRRGRAMLLSISIREGQVLDPERGLAEPFKAAAEEPASAVVQLSGYALSTTQASLTGFDRRGRRVTAVLPVGFEPRGLAIDGAGRRAYVSLGGEDRIAVLDLASGEPLHRIELRAGDRPGELALLPDGRTLLVIGQGSSTALFVDTSSTAVEDRLALPEGPEALLVDPGGHRAYVLSRRTSRLSVIDLANRALVGAIGTDAEPLRARLDRAGTRLHVIHRGSAYLATYAVPGMTLVSRSFVGLGAAALLVDPRTDLIYVGRSDQPSVEVYDPFAFTPIDTIEAPGPVGWLALDPLEGTILMVVPSKRAVAVADLASRRIRAVIEVGGDPVQVALVGERN